MRPWAWATSPGRVLAEVRSARGGRFLAIGVASEILVVGGAGSIGERIGFADLRDPIAAHPAAMIVQVSERSRAEKSSREYHVNDP